MNISRKNFSAIVGALFLGALGSGLWDMLVKPSGRWIGQAVLTVVSLGSSSVKDAVYREAARGAHEAPSLVFLQLLLAVTLTLPFLLLFVTVLLQWLLRRVDSAKSGDLPQTREHSLEEIGRKTKNVKSLLVRQYVSLAVIFFLCGAMAISGLKIIQANDAFTFFSQSMTICRPYMDEKQAELFYSRFARTQGRADFIAITADLRQLATSHQLSLPNYKPW